MQPRYIYNFSFQNCVDSVVINEMQTLLKALQNSESLSVIRHFLNQRDEKCLDNQVGGEGYKAKHTDIKKKRKKKIFEIKQVGNH